MSFASDQDIDSQTDIWNLLQIDNEFDKCMAIELEGVLQNTNVDKSNNGRRTPKTDTKALEKRETPYDHVSLSLFDVFYASIDLKNYIREILNNHFDAKPMELIAESVSITGTKQMANWKSIKQR